MAPKFVAPYRMSGRQGKNDAADAMAICEAVQRPNMRFVPVKNEDQQSRLLVHRARRGFAKRFASGSAPAAHRALGATRPSVEWQSVLCLGTDFDHASRNEEHQYGSALEEQIR